MPPGATERKRYMRGETHTSRGDYDMKKKKSSKKNKKNKKY
tara:strand:+ start:2822 stop:2944 length:123 start_codon:yes stop_codon:yes gene_type:complete